MSLAYLTAPLTSTHRLRPYKILYLKGTPLSSTRLVYSRLTTIGIGLWQANGWTELFDLNSFLKNVLALYRARGWF